jgi:hypothetical protein
MLRTLKAIETIVVCTKCGALIAEPKAHNKKHAIKQDYYDTIKVSELIEQLKMFPENARIGLEMLGYEVEEVKLSVNVENAPAIVLLRA